MSDQNVVAVIQARMGSTRLPGKVMKQLLGQPMLHWVVYRVQKMRLISNIVIATTQCTEDDEIVEYCHSNNLHCYRGSETDLLDRYFQTAREYQADVIVRITSDCPLIDPTICDLICSTFLCHYPPLDFVSNTMQRTYPRGLDVELIPFPVLKLLHHKDKNPAWREHVATYIYKHPDQFRIFQVTNSQDYSSLRWTVDTPEDFQVIQNIFHHFQHGDFEWHEVIRVYEDHPEWKEINTHIQQKTVE